ncbi:MAG: hypothetical protein V3S89_04970, partial [Desulfobacterales bacterium]
VRDRITTEKSYVKKTIIGISVDPEEGVAVVMLRDWELLEKLNELSSGQGVKTARASESFKDAGNLKDSLKRATVYVEESIADMDLPFAHPEVMCMCLICPANR